MVRPRPPAHMCTHRLVGAFSAHACTDMCVRSQCAGNTPPIVAAVTTIIAGVVCIVIIAAPALLFAAPVSLRCHFNTRLWTVCVCGRGSPFASHSRPFASARPVFRWRLLWVTVVSGGTDLQCTGAHLYTSVRVLGCPGPCLRLCS
jgi:hypothetical protein